MTMLSSRLNTLEDFGGLPSSLSGLPYRVIWSLVKMPCRSAHLSDCDHLFNPLVPAGLFRLLN